MSRDTSAALPTPLALSLSKAWRWRFDRLSASGVGIRRTVGVGLALLLAAPALTAGLVDNVDGYTLDARGDLRRFDGLLIDDEGKVAKLLDRRDKRPEKLDFRLDGKGRTLIPGRIESHGDVMALGLAAMRLDLSDTASLEAAQAKLKRHAEANPLQRWIVGFGWSDAAWGLERAPAAADLDAAVSDRPVWLIRADGRAGLANRAAMALASVDPAAAPADGLFVEAAMALIERSIPVPLPRERDSAVALAQDRLLGRGITATADIGTSTDDWNAYRRLGDSGRLRLRIIAYADGIEPLLSIAGARPTPWLYGDRLRMAGVRLDADRFRLDDARLRNLMSRAAMDGFQIVLDAAGDRATAQAIAAIEDLAETYKGDRRWRIERAMIADPAEITRLDRRGIIAAAPPDPLAATRAAAHAAFAEDRIGTLEPGRHADFILLDRAPMAATPAEISQMKVIETWIGGRRAWVGQ